MVQSCSLFGIKTGLIHQGEEILPLIYGGMESQNLEFTDGDILVIAESALATSEGRLVQLDEQKPSPEAEELAAQYQLDPRLAEVVLRESDEIVGGIPGFLLCTSRGNLLPNAGVDGSNAPEGMVSLLPADPNVSAYKLRQEIGQTTGKSVAVLVIDSRTHPMRYGCSGVALGCSGIPSVLDERGRKDLFGRELKVTRRALADNIASAAELLMGEADEGIPVVLVRGLDIQVGEFEGVEQISADECLFMGIISRNAQKRNV
ncbi:MAG: coenzyme F420-0:L-glutamate ligase [Methanospirillum sp.]|uniref:coenzyme F420-0:L-glutamate ligase n=1 Tax=Methanospirillum sp. TaxID=45200 RepID=UPI0023711CE5|nr:coenzyme F420-0:L-glutamate ligase [Methanospirillum sp.]MDD1729095.1 coenzyme F420-0:L-glutamate ligase [Methanospirillum sp.]